MIFAAHTLRASIEGGGQPESLRWAMEAAILELGGSTYHLQGKPFEVVQLYLLALMMARLP